MKQVPVLSILTAVLILITAATAGAQSNAAVLYLRVAAGARPAGMGEAFVSIADDATATYWNPAGLGNAPIAGRLETEALASDFGEIKDVATLTNFDGNVETWVIAGDELIMYDGTAWRAGRIYVTSSDQSLFDFLRTIMNVEDAAQLEMIGQKVVAANFDVTQEEIDGFVEGVRANIPEAYPDIDILEQGLDTLQAGYQLCLLNPERFRSVRDKLKEAMKDSVMTAYDLDKITFSLDQTVNRFLPGQLVVPHAATIVGNMECLSKTGTYLWVGTDNGLYRRSGISWARYTPEHGLPSDTIRALDDRDDHLLIGTSMGMAEYFHGSFSRFPELPKEPATAVSFGSADEAYAVIGGLLYRYDGEKWFDAFSYTVRIDDSIDKIVERIAVYHTESEYEYLADKIRALNESNLPSSSKDDKIFPRLLSPDPESTDTTAASAEPEGDEAMNPESIEVEGDDPSTDMAAGGETESATDPWLVEGNIIKLPYSPILRYEVTALYADDLTDVVWVGTTSGLLAFNGQKWTRYGYKQVVVPGPDSSGQSLMMTSEEIARQELPLADSSRIAILAENIDSYNDLNGAPVSSGEAVYVYNHNTGATIHTIGKVFGRLYVGTEYSLEKKTSVGWEEVDLKGFEQKQYKGVYDYDGQAYYVNSGGLGVETKGRKEFVVMFVKWLPTLNLDMYYGFLSYVHHIRGLGTLGISAIYLTYGNIEYRDEGNKEIGSESPFELSLAASYGASVNSKLKLGITIKVIHSHLSSIGAGAEQGSGIAWAFALDAGMILKFTERMQLGAALTNLGPDISYIDVAQADPLPRNFAVGLSYKLWNSPYNSLVIQGELNKMLTNLNDGFGKELESAIRHIGAEYWYANFIAFRTGYKYDKTGQVKHLTFGAGLQYESARFDLAYVPSSVDSPLANTLRISFSMMF